MVIYTDGSIRYKIGGWAYLAGDKLKIGTIEGSFGGIFLVELEAVLQAITDHLQDIHIICDNVQVLKWINVGPTSSRTISPLRLAFNKDRYRLLKGNRKITASLPEYKDHWMHGIVHRASRWANEDLNNRKIKSNNEANYAFQAQQRQPR